MKIDKLFNVLVVGGAVLTAASAQANDQTVESVEESQIILEELLQGEPIPGALAFCNAEDENTCVENDAGVKVPRAGINCCWGTSCGG